MSDPMKQAWNDVAEDFSRLGKVMKDRYQDRAAAGAPDTDRADADEGVRAAFERLLAAGREFGERITDVMTGDEVKAQAKQTGQRLNDAMTTTADLLGDQVRGVFKGVGRRSDPVDTVVEDVQAESKVDPTEPGEHTEHEPDDTAGPVD
jgi:hypothetical protein